MSGDVLLSDDGGVATPLVAALASLTAKVRPGAFALIGGLAVMARVRSVHRATDDIDGVCEQLGDRPSDVAVALGESGRHGVRRLVEGVTVDHIDVGELAAERIPAEDLPADGWDRAFVLAHRWGLDAASPVTIRAVRDRQVVASVTCLAASPASLVAMKLQSAPRRPTARIHKAANDYLDLQRLLSDAELGPAVAHDLVTAAPHDLGRWALERIRVELVEGADAMARAIRRSGSAARVDADEVEATGRAVLAAVARAEDGAGARPRVDFSTCCAT